MGLKTVLNKFSGSAYLISFQLKFYRVQPNTEFGIITAYVSLKCNQSDGYKNVIHITLSTSSIISENLSLFLQTIISKYLNIVYNTIQLRYNWNNPG
jgi:hypothetical protein